MANDPWEGDIPGRFKPGQKVRGKVTKLTNFGVFVELEPGLEGLLHISELSETPIETPEEVVKVGDDVDVKVLRVDAKDRKIGLSMKNVDDPTVPEDAQIVDPTEPGTADKSGKGEVKKDLRGGTGSAGPLIQMPGQGE
jgi:small subunit ribosomal protein S1